MRRTSTTDYTQRTVDLLMLSCIEAPVSELAVSLDVIREPRIVTGIEKAAQRFTLVFLTSAGSVESLPEEGTEFMPSLGSGRVYDETTLRAAANAACRSAFQQISRSDAELPPPDDERLRSAEIDGVSIDRAMSTVRVRIRLVSQAGANYVYVTPLPTGV